MVAFPIEAEYAKREKECGRRAVDFLRLLGGIGGVFSLSATADTQYVHGGESPLSVVCGNE